MKKNISTWLVIASLLLISTILFACTGQGEAPTDQAESVEAQVETKEPTEPTEEQSTEMTTVEFKQSPMLEGLNLPAVSDRLPKEPKLANQIPLKNLKDGKLEIGQYGGTMRVTSLDPEWNADLFMMLNDPLLNTPGSNGEEITPNILKDFEMSSDGKTFTFYMREGLKWSDGHPVTTEDVAFTVEDFILDEELTPVYPAWLRAGAKKDGDPAKFEVIDDFTFKLSFTEDYGRFPMQLALTGWKGYTELLKPKHYLKDFHIKYTPLEELEPLIKEAGFQPGEWVQLFNDKDVTNWELTQAKVIGFPVLYPWLMVSSSDTIKEYERNPYYWKVDEAGNQLPYIDQIRSEFVQDSEIMTTKVIAGEIDYMSAQASLNNMPLYREYAEKGGYAAPLLNTHIDPTAVFLNQTHTDPVWREVVRDVRFRQALNMGIDRMEIIDAVYFGFAELPQLVPNEFNPERANELLDEMGLDKRSKDGFRLGPDGKVFEIPFESGSHAPDIAPVMELVTQMWNDLGVKTTMKSIDGSLWATRKSANELKATILWNSQPLWRSGGWLDFAPEGLEGSLWTLWHTTEGKEGEIPSDEVKRLFELSQLIMGVYPGTEKDVELYDEIYQLHHDNIYQMSIAEFAKQPIIVSARMGNVPIDGTAVAVSVSGAQLFYRE